MAEAYLKDQRRVLPCCAYLSGEYGVRGLYVGVPVIIGGKGIERIIEINLNVGEKKAFKQSVAAVRTLVNVVKRIQKKSNIELLAIGIGHDVTRYYKKAIKITDVQDLGDVMINQLTDLFQDEKRVLN